MVASQSVESVQNKLPVRGDRCVRTCESPTLLIDRPNEILHLLETMDDRTEAIRFQTE